MMCCTPYRAIKFYQAEVKRKEDLIKEQQKKLEELTEVKRANPSMTEKIENFEENCDALGVDKEVKILTINDIDVRSLHSFKNLIASSIELHRKNLTGTARDNSIKITTPPKINIQDLFDKWYEEGSKDTTYIFRSLDNLNEKSKSGQYAYKVICDWNVNIEGSFLQHLYYVNNFFLSFFAQ